MKMQVIGSPSDSAFIGEATSITDKYFEICRLR